MHDAWMNMNVLNAAFDRTNREFCMVLPRELQLIGRGPLGGWFSPGNLPDLLPFILAKLQTRLADSSIRLADW
jgi:hypothetical protein